MIKKYAVLDENNICINIIKIDDNNTKLINSLKIVLFSDDCKIGNQYDNGTWIEIVPTYSEEEIEELKSSKLEENDNLANKLIYAGFYSGVKNGVQHYSFTIEHQTNMMYISSNISLAILSGTPLTSVEWKNSDQDICEEWSTEEFMQLAADAQTFKTSMIKQHDAFQAAINALTDYEAIKDFKFDYTSIINHFLGTTEE